jgi:hypothetical protein
MIVTPAASMAHGIAALSKERSAPNNNSFPVA